jgi:hypothetical protein
MKIITAFHTCLAVLAALLPAPPARAQTDDFSDNNDTGWTRHSPLAAFGSATSFTVTGGTYRIACEPSLDEAQLGPARAGALRQDIQYQTFCVSVDLKDWNPSEDTSMGILARLQPGPGLGTTHGYAFTYQGKDGDVQMSRIDAEQPTALGGIPPVDLAPGGNYRMIFMGVGPWLEGRIYDMDNPLLPLVTVTAEDPAYTEGTCGLVIFADENTRAAATFDNYLATAGHTAPPALTVEGDGGKVRWSTITGLGHTLEGSTDLVTWLSLSPHSVDQGQYLFVQESPVSSVPASFYRLRLGPPPSIAGE